MRPGLRICALALSFACGACDQPRPPAVAAREPSLDADDLAVMRGLLEDGVRPRLLPVARVLVVETTLATCAATPTLLGAAPGACLDPRWVELVSRMLPADRIRTATLDFQARNARRRPIGPVLGAAATYISASVTDFVPLPKLLRQYPPGSVVLALSTPSYPAPRLAVIAYSSGGIVGAASLERRSDGRWTVAASQYGGVD